jgi:hypothetical protein
MRLDTLNMMFAVAFLQARKVPREKVIAASMGAGLIGGPMGLLLPVMAAGTGSAGTTTTTGGASGPPAIFGSTVKVAVPDVVGQPLDKASKQVEDAKLRPITSVYHTGDVEEHGQVVQQDPEAGRLVAEASQIDLTVAVPPQEEDLSESEKEDKILKVVEGTATKVDELLARRKEPKEPKS